MLSTLAMVLATLLPGSSGNLLSNASFEELHADGAPMNWSSFVLDQPGAFAEIDPLSHEGRRSAMLHAPRHYASDPGNNWSQVVVTDVAGKDLLLSGFVRTEAATEAALWIQCFQRNPVRVVAAKTSSDSALLAGTSEWKWVETRISAPHSTDFVIVRCVLKGQGSAWFDGLVLAVAPDESPKLDVLEPQQTSPDTPEVERETLQETDLLDLSRTLQEAVRDLETNNAQLLRRIRDIQEELQRNRMPTQLEPLDELATGHPLLPHNYAVKETAP